MNQDNVMNGYNSNKHSNRNIFSVDNQSDKLNSMRNRLEFIHK